MHIEIDIPRPYLTLCLVAAIGGWVYWYNTPAPVTATVTGGETLTEHVQPETYGKTTVAQVPSDNVLMAEGGDDTAAALKIRENEEEAMRIRIEQEVLSHKADILRGQIRFLEDERRALGDKVDVNLENQFKQSSQILIALLQDQKKSEHFLLASLNQIWEAQGKAIALGQGLAGGEGGTVNFLWPVEPRLGISAIFHDAGYKERFGLQHDAIDIPTPQGTLIRAAADGVVKDVVDHGLGFNYITIKHAGGTSTLYGHLSSFKVQAGQKVRAGDPIAYSGGRPGTPGAGFSTGPHLHFGVFENGAAVDPQTFLPAIPVGLAADTEEESAQ